MKFECDLLNEKVPYQIIYPIPRQERKGKYSFLTTFGLLCSSYGQGHSALLKHSLFPVASVKKKSFF